MRPAVAVIRTLVVMCAVVGRVDAQSDRGGQRVFYRGSWKEMEVGAVSTTGRPELQVAGSRAAYIYDYSTHQLRALDSTGRVLWTSSGSGGPVPQMGFANPSDMKLDESNRLWINDPYIGIVFVMSEQGTVLRRIQALHSAARMVLRPDGGFWLWDEAIRGGGFSIYSADGQRAGQVPLRDSRTGIDTLAAIVRVPLLASGSRPGSPIVQTFSWSSDFLIWDAPSHKPVTVHGVEPLSFPAILAWGVGGRQRVRVPPDASRGTLSTVVDDSLIYVLFSGMSEYKNRLIDTYLLKDGRYVGSYLLPEPVFSMSRLGGRFITTTTEPAASVRIWTWLPSSKPTRAK